MIKPIKNLTNLKYHYQAGFTIVEALVAIAIIGVIGFILSDLLSRTFKGGNKSQLIGSIKQNGQSVLNNIDLTVRNSDSVVCAQSATYSTLVLNKQGKYVRYRFYPPTSSANGYIGQDSPTWDNPIEASSLCDDSQLQRSTDIIYLTDRNLYSGVSVEATQFIRITNPGVKDSINIKISIAPGIKAKETFDSSVLEPIKFDTTVVLR